MRYCLSSYKKVENVHDVKVMYYVINVVHLNDFCQITTYIHSVKEC